MESVKEQLRGQPIMASWLNQLRNNQKSLINTSGAGPIKVSQQANGVQVSIDPKAARTWLGMVTSDAVSASDYSDARYFVQRQTVSNDDVVTSDNAAALSDYIEYEGAVFPDSDIVTATNLAEWDATSAFDNTTKSKHLLPYNTPVTVFEYKDESVPPQSRYAFYAEPALCIDDTYSPAGSDEIYILPSSSDITGDPSDAGNWHMTGHMYVDSAHQVNPWVTIDPGVVGITFAVKVTKTGGNAGTSSDQCSFTYTVKDVKGEVTLGTSMTPEKHRPTTGEMVSPSDGDFGLGFYNGSTFVLYDANESLQTSDCS